MNGLILDAQRSTLLTLQSLTRSVSRRKPKPAHLLLGERGEFEALFHLRRQGYLVIERRWRSPDHNGDLDLVAFDGPTLCFIEVKTRSARDLTPAASAIDDAKRRMLRNMARSFLRTLPREQRETERDQTVPRFDVVSVYLPGPTPECELLRDAFPWHPGSFAE
jgi:putative endonuclease